MLILEANHIKKYFGDRLILNIDNLKIYKNDRIGLVGLNGAGKTTLMNILSQKIVPDEGWVRLYGKYGYITQLDNPEGEGIDPKLANEFGVEETSAHYLSGGEKTRVKIAQNLSKEIHVLFADEPTCNLDMKGIELLEEKLKTFDGALVIISHDRALLDKLCNKMLEVENGKLIEYPGNYTDYKAQKEMKLKREHFEYTEYIKEKRRLEQIIVDKKEKSGKMKKTPTRMGNSEARLHKRSTTARQAVIERSAKVVQSRIEQLNKKEKPKKKPKVTIDIPAIDELHSKVVINVKNLTKTFGKKVLFKKVNFQILNSKKVALIGDNGTGKTTLIRMILHQERGVTIAPSAKIAYFSQELEILDNNSTILENVMKDSIQPPHLVRTILARLLFKNEEVFKKVNVLSGGERVKVALAKLFVKDINLIILDEPTNFLDIDSIEALEDVLADYQGTLLFISHDRRFIDDMADQLIMLDNGDITLFEGNYTQYIENQEQKLDPAKEDLYNRKMLLENRLSEVTGRLSIPSKDDNILALDAEFKEIIQELKSIEKHL